MHQFGAGMEFQFVHQMITMGFDCSFRDEKSLRNFGVGMAIGQ